MFVKTMVLYNHFNEILLLVFVLFDGGWTTPGTGKCPNKNSTVLIWSNFQGFWYEYASYGDYMTRMNYKCIKYRFNTNETAVGAVRQYQNQWTGTISSTNYQIEYDGFYDFIMKPDSGSSYKMWILDTDYNSFAILWTCVDYSLGGYYVNYESSWIITRFYKEYASVEEEIRIDKALARHSLQRIWYDLVKRDQCTNFP